LFSLYFLLLEMPYRKVTLIYSDTNMVVLETHRMDDKLHRSEEEGPACIHRDEETSAVLEERYYWKGRLHRERGPAVIKYNIGTIAVVEMYYRHGSMHRDPKHGPAWVERDHTGTLVLIESYHLNGRPFRDPADGPQHIERREDGCIEHEAYSEPRSRSHAGRRPGPPILKNPSP
jgi:hypothetical protein